MKYIIALIVISMYSGVSIAEEKESIVTKKISIIPDFKVTLGSKGLKVETIKENDIELSSTEMDKSESTLYKFTKLPNFLSKTSTLVVNTEINKVHYQLKSLLGFKTLEEKSGGDSDRAKWIEATSTWKYTAVPGHSFLMREKLSLPEIYGKKVLVQIELIYADKGKTVIKITHEDCGQGSAITNYLTNKVVQLTNI